MAKKTTGTRKGRKSNAKAEKSAVVSGNPGRPYELLGLACVAAGFISLGGLFDLNVGFVGLYFAKFLHYFFGVGAIFVCVLILLMGYQYITKHCGLRYSLRFFGLGLLYVSVLAIWHHFVIPPGEEILPASLPEGGGLLGGGLLLVLRNFFGVDGAIILLAACLIGSVLLSTTWSLATGVNKTKEKAVKGASAAGTALAATSSKVAEVGGRVEERVVEAVKTTVKNSFYNQERDDRFSEALETDSEHVPSGEPEEAASAAEEYVYTPEPEAPVQEPVPAFTIDYGGRGGEENAGEPWGLPQEPVTEREAEAAALGAMTARSAVAEAEAASAEAITAMARAEAGSEAKPDEKPRKPYEIPQVSQILSKHVKQKNAALEMEIAENARTLQQTLENFHVKAKILNACHGPAVTRYELEPAPGVKVSKITNLADDIALSLAAFSVRIEPIPGKAAIGIEVPNKELEGVQLREVLESEKFSSAKSRLTVGLGMDIGGQAIFADLGKMPHLLVAGATGSGKSVCINTLITSILFKAKPDEVKFILIDPKMVELSGYNGIPHLMVPVVTDAKKAASVLNWAVQEMEKRYSSFADHGVRNMAGFNEHFPEQMMPAIVIIIDELADLMMVAPHDVEDAICRLAQKARAAGIHMVLATQRPSVDVITGIIKANIPSRISFAVSSQIDSRTILDRSGAEKLLGKGDMLFYPVGSSKPRRVQGAFISDEEVEHLLDFIRSQGQEAETNEELVNFTERAAAEAEEAENGKKSKEPQQDELLEEAVNLVLSTGQASTSSVQRRFRVGYTRAARLIDAMEELGIVGPNVGSKPREILMNSEEALAAVQGAQ
ncbi:MAG: DNA translocase FtsK 4TM domain-containing protein [Selenomonas sp.]|nr:DNA translocase FtsK 4TM domain-containing protein [Selenomonas sp.]